MEPTTSSAAEPVLTNDQYEDCAIPGGSLNPVAEVDTGADRVDVDEHPLRGGCRRADS
jgi:hypothetical protein